MLTTEIYLTPPSLKREILFTVWFDWVDNGFDYEFWGHEGYREEWGVEVQKLEAKDDPVADCLLMIDEEFFNEVNELVINSDHEFPERELSGEIF